MLEGQKHLWWIYNIKLWCGCRKQTSLKRDNRITEEVQLYHVFNYLYLFVFVCIFTLLCLQSSGCANSLLFSFYNHQHFYLQNVRTVLTSIQYYIHSNLFLSISVHLQIMVHSAVLIFLVLTIFINRLFGEVNSPLPQYDQSLQVNRYLFFIVLACIWLDYCAPNWWNISVLGWTTLLLNIWSTFLSLCSKLWTKLLFIVALLGC